MSPEPIKSEEPIQILPSPSTDEKFDRAMTLNDVPLDIMTTPEAAPEVVGKYQLPKDDEPDALQITYREVTLPSMISPENVHKQQLPIIPRKPALI